MSTQWWKWWKRRRPGPTGDSSDPDDPAARQLRPISFTEEAIPRPARTVWAALKLQVAIRAAFIHDLVADPATGSTWRGQRVESLAPAAFAQGAAMAQDEGAEQSRPPDEAYLAAAEAADEQTNLALATIEETDKILDDSVEFPPGGRGSGHDTMVAHRADRERAARRERDGNFRHLHREVERYWIVAAAIVVAALDVMLLWRPLLNLGPLTSAGALYRWVLAVAFAAAQALVIELVISHYRDRERAATAQRDIARDFDRDTQHSYAHGDRHTLTLPPPPLQAIQAADTELRAAHRWLLLTATGVGLIGVFRVAFLSREAGQSIAEATLFGAFVGVVFFALVVLLGALACRGNQLGDLLRAGAVVVAHLDVLTQEGQRRVAGYRFAALQALAASDKARAEAKDTREWVVGEYWQAMLLAASWLGLPEPAVAHSELVLPRILSVAEAADHQVEIVRSKLERIDAWLDVPAPAPTGTALALPVPREPTTQRLGPPEGQPAGLVRVGLGYPIPQPAREPWWLLLTATAVAVAIAYTAAIIAPTPDTTIGPITTAAAVLTAQVR